tara:strand:+ start:786 stop:1559 length:774 start_codon:yes stop_codon:yes gene_type:complete
MGTKRLGQARLETLAKSMGKRDGGIPIPQASQSPNKYHELWDEFDTCDISTAAAVTAGATAGHASKWLSTIAGGCSVLLDIALPGGQVKLLTDNTDNDVINLQAPGAGFKFANSKKLWFETRIALADVDKSGLFVGLASNSGAADPSVQAEYIDAVGFGMVDGAASTALNHVVAKSSDETNASLDTATALTDGTYVVLSIYWDGSSLFFYVDGTLVSQPAVTNLPDDVVVNPTIEFATRNGAIEHMHVDYIRVVQER